MTCSVSVISVCSCSYTFSSARLKRLFQSYINLCDYEYTVYTYHTQQNKSTILFLFHSFQYFLCKAINYVLILSLLHLFDTIVIYKQDKKAYFMLLIIFTIVTITNETLNFEIEVQKC